MTIVNKILGRVPDTEFLKTRDFNPYSDLEESEWYYADILEATITHTYELSNGGKRESVAGCTVGKKNFTNCSSAFFRKG